MSPIKVRVQSETRMVAGAIAGVLRNEQVAEVQAIGVSAVNQMVKAIIIARRFLSEEGITTTCEPDMVNLIVCRP